MNRRRLLALLGGGAGVAGGAYLVAFDTENTADQLEPLDRPNPQSRLNSVSGSDRSTGDSGGDESAMGASAPKFIDTPVNEPISGDAAFTRVRGRPVDSGSGDRFSIATSEGSDASELAGRIRLGVDVGQAITTEAEIGGQKLTFAGGKVGGQVTLVAPLEKDADTIYVARGDTVDAAKGFASNWTL